MGGVVGSVHELGIALRLILTIEGPHLLEVIEINPFAPFPVRWIAGELEVPVESFGCGRAERRRAALGA